MSELKIGATRPEGRTQAQPLNTHIKSFDSFSESFKTFGNGLVIGGNDVTETLTDGIQGNCEADVNGFASEG